MPLELRSRVNPGVSVPSDLRTFTGVSTGMRWPERLSDRSFVIGSRGSVHRLSSRWGLKLSFRYWLRRVSRLVSYCANRQHLFQARQIRGSQAIFGRVALIDRSRLFVGPRQQKESFGIVLIFFKFWDCIFEVALGGEHLPGRAMPAFLNHEIAIVGRQLPQLVERGLRSVGLGGQHQPRCPQPQDARPFLVPVGSREIM